MRTRKLKIKKGQKNVKKIKSKKIKGGAALSQLLPPDLQPSLSISFPDACKTPRCVSCRYFALKAYFLKIGYTLKDMDILFAKYSKRALDSLAKPFDPNNLNTLPDFAPIFITSSNGIISSPLHVFIIRRRIVYKKVGIKRNKTMVYSIDSSWSQSRAGTEKEWLDYKSNHPNENINLEDFDVSEITHSPTTQRLFTEDELKDMLSNISDNLQKLF